jgi:hypothetical protein
MKKYPNIGKIKMKTTKTEQLKQFYYISDYAKDLLNTIPEEFEQEKKEFKFMTLKELGFKKVWIETREFLNEEFLASKGLSFCEPQDVFQIVEDLKNEECAYVGMKPIPDRDGDLELFVVAHDVGKLWLDNNDGGPDRRWDGRNRLVFLSRKLELSSDDTQTLPSSTLSLELAIKICKEAGLTVTKVY